MEDIYLAQERRFCSGKAGAEAVATIGSTQNTIEFLENKAIGVGVIDISLCGILFFDLSRALELVGVPFLFLSAFKAKVCPADLADVPIQTYPASSDTVVEIVD